MGILGTAGAGGKGKLSEVEKKVTVSSMCRRRLGVVMTRLKMADTVQAVGNHPFQLLLSTLLCEAITLSQLCGLGYRLR